MLKIWQDCREIESIWEAGLSEGDGYSWMVGLNGVTKIVCYLENGPGAHMPWLAVYEGVNIKVRIPAHVCGVTYCKEEKANDQD